MSRLYSDYKANKLRHSPTFEEGLGKINKPRKIFHKENFQISLSNYDFYPQSMFLFE